VTYDQVIAKLAELSAQCVTKPDNDFAKMAESLQFHVASAMRTKHGATGLCCGLREQEKARADIADTRAEALATEVEDLKRSLEVSRDELTQIQHDIPTLHLRRCWACMTGKRGNDSPIFAVHWHADSVTPWVLCPVCGSQDTRKIKVHDLMPEAKPAPPPPPPKKQDAPTIVVLREDQTVSRKKRRP
jgi:hypothetical protein